MIEPNQQIYYARREREARALAEASIDQAIRKIHLGMAARYAQMARQEPAPPVKHGRSHFDLL